MTYVLGVDIGTRRTAAAIARMVPGEPVIAQQLALARDQNSVPSVVFFTETGHALIGEAAALRGPDGPDRLVRGFVRRIGDEVPLAVGQFNLLPEHLLATVARWVLAQAEEQEGSPPGAVVISHPADWGQYRIGLVRQALSDTGLSHAALLSAPVAAALLHYDQRGQLEMGGSYAVYGLGGSSCSATVLQKAGAGAFEVLGRPERIERLGGADVDESVFEHVAAGTGGAFSGLDAADPQVLTGVSRLRGACIQAKEALSSGAAVSVPVLLPGLHARAGADPGGVKAVHPAGGFAEEYGSQRILAGDPAGIPVPALVAAAGRGFGQVRIPLDTGLLAGVAVAPVLTIAAGPDLEEPELLDEEPLPEQPGTEFDSGFAARLAASTGSDRPCPEA